MSMLMARFNQMAEELKAYESNENAMREEIAILDREIRSLNLYISTLDVRETPSLIRSAENISRIIRENKQSEEVKAKLESVLADLREIAHG